jgi:hypothetical protein
MVPSSAINNKIQIPSVPIILESRKAEGNGIGRPSVIDIMNKNYLF